MPLAYRLDFPREWAEDRARRNNAGVSEEVKFQTKPGIALEEIREALASNLPRGVVLADAGCGADMRFREGLSALGLPYAVAVLSTTSV